MTEILDSVEQAANLQSILDAAAEVAPAQTKSGVQRSKEIDAAIANGDLDELMGLQIKLNKVVEKILAVKIDPENLGDLSQEELETLAVEQLDLKDIERLLEVRYQLRRLAVFMAIRARNEAKDIKDPFAGGTVLMPSLGMKWVKSGGTLRAALDKAAFREAVGEEVWAKVCDTVEVPAVAAHTEQVFSEEKMFDLLQGNPALMSVVANHVVPGGRSPERLNLSKMTKEDKVVDD